MEKLRVTGRFYQSCYEPWKGLLKPKAEDIVLPTGICNVFGMVYTEDDAVSFEWPLPDPYFPWVRDDMHNGGYGVYTNTWKAGYTIPVEIKQTGTEVVYRYRTGYLRVPAYETNLMWSYGSYLGVRFIPQCIFF